MLDPCLTSAGAKIPKWQPRSQQGQYVGVSPVHAENISVISNLKTGYLSHNITLYLMIGLKQFMPPMKPPPSKVGWHVRHAAI